MDQQEPGLATRTAQWLRCVRFPALVTVGAIYVLVPAFVGGPWLHEGLPLITLAVFLWLPGLETFARNFREGYRGEGTPD